MDALLIGEWLGNGDRIAILDEASVSVLRDWVREEAARSGLSSSVSGALVNVASELGHNQLAHAREGEVSVRAIVRNDVPGLEIVAADRGPGILNPTRVLSGVSGDPIDRSASGKSLGIGLSAVRELADEVDFDTRIGEGTCIFARKFALPVPRRREVGIFGRPHPDESVSGDHGGFVRDAGSLLLGVVDGLGHGPEAREASSLAVQTMISSGGLSLGGILNESHRALVKTRGAVMGLARVSEELAFLQTACIGNATIHVFGIEGTRRFSGPSTFLGAAGALRRVDEESTNLGARDVVVLSTDGLSRRTDLEGEFDLLREHPFMIAHQLVERFANGNDDVLVIVAR